MDIGWLELGTYWKRRPAVEVLNLVPKLAKIVLSPEEIAQLVAQDEEACRLLQLRS